MKLRQGGVWANVDTYIREGGQWKYVNFIRDASELLLIISITTVDLNLQTAFNNAFGITAWTSSIKKRVIINPGVIVGSSSASPFNYALTIPTGLGGTLRVENYGSIQGAGGLPNGGNGGNAIFAGSPVTFDNQGTIYAGGGAGGLGGTGGLGVYDCSYTAYLGASNVCVNILFDENGNVWPGAQGSADLSCSRQFGSGSYCTIGFPNATTLCIIQPIFLYYKCNNCYRFISQLCYTGGGAGGAGGLGQGFNQNLTGGSGGGGGGINAGTGGTGGTGGNWGEVGGNGFPGSNGNYTVGSGGGSGGLPGYYIVNSGLVTWTNLGAVAGFAI
jgi:hypothetical protein